MKNQLVLDYYLTCLCELILLSKQKLKQWGLLKFLFLVYAIKDNKVGLAIGITQELSKKINAVDLIKIGSEIIGGKGGGGRADFAQAGGSLIEKIDESFEKIKNLIN